MLVIKWNCRLIEKGARVKSVEDLASNTNKRVIKLTRNQRQLYLTEYKFLEILCMRNGYSKEGYYLV